MVHKEEKMSQGDCRITATSLGSKVSHYETTAQVRCIPDGDVTADKHGWGMLEMIQVTEELI